MSCTFERDGCTVDYQVVLSGPFNTMGSVFVGEERGTQLLITDLYNARSTNTSNSGAFNTMS